jgi:uncharacterized protein YqcC (DUF446 family)
VARTYDRASQYADRIEAELRGIGGWQPLPLPEEAYQSRSAFGGDTMSFYQWLQFVLVPRIRDIAASSGQFPSSSQVGAYAVRELDGVNEASGLISLLSEFDEFIEAAAR